MTASSFTRHGARAALTAIALALATGAGAADVTLKASHQFPGGKGDVRDEMVQMIAKEVAAAKVGLEIKVFPGSSLVKAQEQWKAMLTGQIDMSVVPARLRLGLSPAVRRHADARPRQEPCPCAAHQRLSPS